jgi:hypothetical protein
MTDGTETKDGHRATLVPAITMKEVPVLSEGERRELLTSLKDAEARVKADNAIDYDPKSFKDRLIAILRDRAPSRS